MFQTLKLMFQTLELVFLTLELVFQTLGHKIPLGEKTFCPGGKNIFIEYSQKIIAVRR